MTAAQYAKGESLTRGSFGQHKLVNGEFKEAQGLYAELESMNEETFILFAQYAYTGDYNREIPKEAKSFIVENSQTEVIVAYPNPDVAEPALDAWGWGVNSKKTKCNKLWSEFKKEHSTALPARKDWPATKPCAGNVILSHAQLYVFADCYGISGLMYLSFGRLGNVLVDTEVDDDKVEDIVDTLQYCYDELTPPKLRSLLVLYAACKIETLWKCTKFRELSTRHGELSTAIIGAMIGRLG
ncbi:hypothetical protein B0T26DRAFT_744250 [Lasiosphaeria miniovina]|uniref:Uncharacterized protein n=1 Tax=Lasiosphaeria miniovina TaxID=1954250 RepID=A0AA39ZTV3_9PEZI|nr:uncharacterized protein B0T26DRAFT_744250 [Lasiosphaeria miniovina]KAK0703420.1 hypothetical protein B0T26DRAFT_744250 [Lasiosphaeria miniovina]